MKEQSIGQQDSIGTDKIPGCHNCVCTTFVSFYVKQNIDSFDKIYKYIND